MVLAAIAIPAWVPLNVSNAQVLEDKHLRELSRVLTVASTGAGLHVIAVSSQEN